MSSTGFSYAQAARGQAAPPISNSSLPSQAAQDKADQGSSAALQNSSPPPSLATAENGKISARPLYSESGIGQRKADSDAASAAGSSTLAATLTDSTSNLSLDDRSRNATVGEKDGSSSASGTRTSSADDVAGKARKGKQNKTSANGNDQPGAAADEPERPRETPKVELAPAPLPAVNIWDQRRKEQAAKSKSSPTAAVKPAASSPVPNTATTTTSAAATTNGGSKPKDAKKYVSIPAESESNGESNAAASAGGTKSQPRRSGETNRSSNDQSRRNGPRGSRSAEKDDKTGANRESLPSVQDVSHWPTPESAAVVEDAKPKAHLEKTDAVDKDGSEDALSSKYRGKRGWTTMEFVPTVSFQTPMPNVRGSKPKTGGRGGRDSSSRGGYNSFANGTSPSDKNSSAAASLSDKAAFESQEGSKEGNSGSAPGRLPPQSASNLSKRFSTDSPHNREPRKSAANAPFDKTKDASHDYVASTRAEFVPRGNHNISVNGDQHHASHPGQSDRRLPSTARNNEHNTPGGRDSSSQQMKEHQGQASRTESRPERSGRGGYRGSRGGHAGSSSQNHHLPHTSYQSNGQQRVGANTGFGGSSTSNLPPTAAPYSPMTQQFPFGGVHNAARPNRNNGRSQSVPHPSPFANRLQNGTTNAQRHHSQSIQVATGGLPAELAIPQYPYQPHNPYVESDLLQGIVTQLDYYFSVENLCKDVYLRKKMDDQGFVPLVTVAAFNRLASLAPSLDFIRAACEMSENLEFVTDVDERDLIRSREHWGRFTLNRQERDVEARIPGPDLNIATRRSSHSRPQVYEQSMISPGYQPMYPGFIASERANLVYPAFENGIHVDHAPISNGYAMNDRPQAKESKLSAAVPDFSPSGMNGGASSLDSLRNNSAERASKPAVAVNGSAGEFTDAVAAPDGVEGHSKTH